MACIAALHVQTIFLTEDCHISWLFNEKRKSILKTLVLLQGKEVW